MRIEKETCELSEMTLMFLEWFWTAHIFYVAPTVSVQGEITITIFDKLIRNIACDHCLEQLRIHEALTLFEWEADAWWVGEVMVARSAYRQNWLLFGKW